MYWHGYKLGDYPNKVIKCANWYSGLECSKKTNLQHWLFYSGSNFSTPESKNVRIKKATGFQFFLQHWSIMDCI